MKKAILPYAIICLLLVPSILVAQGGIKKYLKPAQITELDWILMKVNISVSYLMPIENYGLVLKGSYQALPNIEKVAITFLVDKEKYFKLENHTISKIFVDVVEVFYGLLSTPAPEISLTHDVVAHFYLADDYKKQIASFENGKLKLEEKRF